VKLGPGAEIELCIQTLAAGGDGVGRHEGRVIFVPLTAPGDRVRAEVVREHARYAHARLLEVLHPGPDRREPPCSLFGHCGGCTWMHLSEGLQRAARVEIVRDALARIGGVNHLPPVELLASPESFRYRARARVAVEAGRVGFRERGSRRVVDVEDCAVLDAETQHALARLRADPPRGPTEVEIVGFGGEARVGKGVLRVGKGAFFQANRFLWEPWQSAVAEACGEGGCLVELYAGAGFYTVLLTERFARVVAVERGTAARSARANTEAEIVKADAELWAPEHLPKLAPEVVLLNPPRKGCHVSVSGAIRDAAPGRVVYVSCEPTTLARDVARLSEFWRVTKLVVIDALPQTHHVEVICVLEYNKPRPRRGNVLTSPTVDS
jgi:tRNA/tmRNA/rRNA uracil-C5-methylase (TrmA/RlmC/RlmD family)